LIMDATPQDTAVRARPLVCPPPAQAFLLPVSGFPVPPDELAKLGAAVRRIVSSAGLRWKLSAEVFIRLSQLNAEGVERLSSNARTWRPQPGLGVWPSRGPERMWTKEEFTSLDVEDKPRIAMEHMFHVSSAVQTDVLKALSGSGAIGEFLVPGGAKIFLARARELYQPMQTQEAFRAFKMYVPLLDEAGIAGASYDGLRIWLCGAKVCLRESAEHKGLLMVSLEPLTALLEEIGARREPDGDWLI
jgi:hypothetical protein